MATGRATRGYLNAFQYRINGGSPQVMEYKRKREEKYECKDAEENSSVPWWYQKQIDNLRNVNSIDIYYTQSIAAYITYRVELKVMGFKPIIFGTIDCTQKSIERSAPSFFKQCKKGTSAVLKVHAVHPELAYETAGMDLERFMDAVQDQWRVNIMKLVKQGVAQRQLDPNQNINSMQFQKAIGYLHQQCKSKELGLQFEGALKTLLNDKCKAAGW